MGRCNCVLYFNNSNYYILYRLAQMVHMYRGIRCTAFGAVWVIKTDYWENRDRLEIPVHVFYGQRLSGYLEAAKRKIKLGGAVLLL